jgi:arylsulfatase A-like enzyme
MRLLLLALLSSAATLCAADPMPPAARPNIVLILADDLGYGDVGAYNPKSRIPTPNLDRLATEGLRFTDAHAGGSVCVPSRYALLTGRFAARATLEPGKGPVIEEDRKTIATLLREHGYRTAMVGKWHQGFETLHGAGGKKEEYDYAKPLRGGPVDRGFDSFFGQHASLDIPPYFYIRDRAPTQPPTDTIEASTSVGGPDEWTNIQGAFWRAGPVAPDYRHAEVPQRITAEAVEVLRGHAVGKRDRPLFLYFALVSPHTPWVPSEPFRGRSGAGLYGDYVMETDAIVGRMLDELARTGLATNTLLIFTSDNGPVWYPKDVARFGHDAVGGLRGLKASSYDGGHRMPFLVRWPGVVRPGSVSAQTIAFSDVFATFAELMGSPCVPEGAAEDSESFLPYLLDAAKAPAPRAPIVHDVWTIRDGDWKLILPRGKQAPQGKAPRKPAGELFNLREDLAEQHNLLTEQPERAQRMRTQLEAILQGAAAPVRTP